MNSQDLPPDYENLMARLKLEYLSSFTAKFLRMERLLNQLMNNPQDMDSLEQLMNLVHKIHGTAGSYDLDDLGSIAIEWERQLDGLFSGQMVVDRLRITSMFEYLRKMKEVIEIR